ncbi:HNH endonuclease [Loktanella sp. D2R18]|uniref:HNH endonuclease n=1 Tax=Rhodobacterales TaxID=204455 RepID=UPI000DE8E519|nr:MULTISPECIES: HNH endonuclease [Rhodobacterales]MDO6592197.1 HNH endonuclease [Yoonia sp. 1_MG-2023]RBW44521.1 HNH endonuclease [Loktanella sp. D2R18]
MVRLSSVGSRLRAARPRLVVAPQSETDRSRSRDRDQSWRAWYKTARWQKLRLVVLKRDGYTCQQTGVLLIGTYPAEDSAVVDHKVPHRGDERLFWNIDNLQSVSKAYHDSTKQSLERRGLA